MVKRHSMSSMMHIYILSDVICLAVTMITEETTADRRQQPGKLYNHTDIYEFSWSNPPLSGILALGEEVCMAAVTFLVRADAGPAPAPDQRRREGIFLTPPRFLSFRRKDNRASPKPG